jgi:succinate dehydrogenase / fumarate reductase membrane anchor subunit
MVKNITSFTGSGLKDWFLQRVTAVVLALYVFFLVGVFAFHHTLNFAEWSRLFSYGWVKVFTLVALLSLIVHAWVGVWTIFTDYIKCSVARGFLMTVICLGFISYIVWCVLILWG